MNVMITGGAGYIGSHAVMLFVEKGHNVTVIDNLSTGYLVSVDKRADFYKVDIRNKEKLKKVLVDKKIEMVVHFAAFSLVAESILHPKKYFDNNVYGTKVLLEAMNEAQVKKIVFSSSAAVYGEQKVMPIKENAFKKPTNPYGETKLEMEKLMKWSDQEYGIKYISLRYFNVAGAHHSGVIGEMHNPETHLIPLVLQVPLGQRDHIEIFGDDYATPDGTCIRDYIHVEDLTEAHLLAMHKLSNSNNSSIYNLGSGKGYSVLEIIESAKKITKKNIKTVIEKRRKGDPEMLIASSEKAEKELGWTKKYDDISSIISSAWKFHRKNKEGFNNEYK